MSKTRFDYTQQLNGEYILFEHNGSDKKMVALFENKDEAEFHKFIMNNALVKESEE